MHWLRIILPGLVLGSAAAACTEANPYINICGNALVEEANAEECDDGNGNDNAAACTDECKVAVCGDGLVYNGVEACDLGDENNPDGPCTLECTFVTCGDGNLNPGEACDDGPANKPEADGQGGCSELCELLPMCGDGVVQAAWEECDDGNTDDTDGCTNSCKLGSCGDGNVQPGVEECDDGNDDDTDACTNSCTLATCGDGVLQAGVEECDDANDDNSDACLSACLLATCGDGVLQVGVEECDDANDDNSDACLSSCTLATCGDGVLRVGVEECDDGNLDPDDGCNAACFLDRMVFVSFAASDGAELMGITNAEARCAIEAEAAGLANPERFRPWLSDSSSSPATRFEIRGARYVLVGGSAIADDWDDLTDGELSNPLNNYADGIEADVAVWTGTSPSGEAVDTDEFCSDWSVADDSLGGHGLSSSVASSWTFADPSLQCSAVAHFYCFED